jgi:hypothetical protein
MRKFLQQKVFSLLETLREAQREGLYAECQNGALGDRHYEGAGHHGMVIDITDRQGYGLGALHSGIIFTFNQYGGYNYVTGTHIAGTCMFSRRSLRTCYFVALSGYGAEMRHLAATPA